MKTKDTDISGAIKILKHTLKDDSDYYMGWQANIAMAIYDEFNHEIDIQKANDSARRFLDNFIAYN